MFEQPAIDAVLKRKYPLCMRDGTPIDAPRRIRHVIQFMLDTAVMLEEPADDHGGGSRLASA